MPRRKQDPHSKIISQIVKRNLDGLADKFFCTPYDKCGESAKTFVCGMLNFINAMNGLDMEVWPEISARAERSEDGRGSDQKENG